MSDLNFRNAETRETFFDILTDLIRENPRDPMEYVRSWTDVGQGDAAGPLSRQLRKDAHACYGRAKDQCLMLTLMRAGLKRVDFKQIAAHLIWLTAPVETAPEGEDDGAAA
jgi:hypothetical protein